MALASFKEGLRKPGSEGESLRDGLPHITALLAGKVVDYTEAHGGSREVLCLP